MIRRPLLLLVVVALLAAGCDDEPHETLRSELRRARTVWAQQGIEEYDMILERQIVQFLFGTVRIRVRDAEVVAREPVDLMILHVPEGTTEEEIIASAYPAVERLFETIQTAIDDEADRIDVRFHPNLGYPLEIEIDPRVGTADDGAFFEVVDFEIARP